MRRFITGLMVLILVGFVAPAFGAQFSLHGDFNNRFVYGNHFDFFKTADKGAEINGEDVDEFWAEFKYRLVVDASTNDGNVKGVYAVEIGQVRFGKKGGGAFSGDGVNVETRWAYTDFQLPFVKNKSRVKIGLQPFNVNPHLWKETAAGVSWDGSVDDIGYQLAWMRGYEIKLTTDPSDKGIKDNDGFLGRLNFKPAPGLKTGVFMLYQTGDPDMDPGTAKFDSRKWEVKMLADKVKMDIYTLGIDGNYKTGPLFAKYSLMYQGGSMDNVGYTDYLSQLGRTGDFDLSTYFGQLEMGIKHGKATFTYKFRYASGDDDPTDDKFNAFIATDVDDKDPYFLSGDMYVGSETFSETGYILDKGFILNALKFDYKATSKLRVGCAFMYLLSAEDLEYTAALNGQPQSSNDLGFELSGYVSYKLYKNLELAFNGGYQFSGDAMDAFETPDIQDGKSDEDLWAVSSKVRLRF